MKEFTHEGQRHSRPEQRRAATDSGVSRARQYDSDSGVTSDITPGQPARGAEERSTKRQNHVTGLTKHKSADNLKRRRSWFGAKPAEEHVPEVPSLPHLGHQKNRHMNAPATALVIDEQTLQSTPATPDAYEGKEKRKSILGNQKRSQSAVSSKPKKRQSWFGGRALDDDAPPIPSIPTLNKSEQPNSPSYAARAPEKEDKSNRRLSLSRALSRSRSKSNVSTKSKRRSWFQSSNPDHDEDDNDAQPPLPPMPALTHDHGHLTSTSGSSVSTTRSPDQSEYTDPFIDPVADSPLRSFTAEEPIYTAARCSSIKQPRPVSGVSTNRRSYVPKNAASGFLKSTSGRRASKTHSLLDDGDGGRICLSEEQQREWDKLKHLMEVMENRQGKRTSMQILMYHAQADQIARRGRDWDAKGARRRGTRRTKT